MSHGPIDPMEALRAGEARVYRAEPAGLRGWIVYLVGDPKTYGFLNQELATTYARNLARENKPSVVVVIDADGTVIKGWEFPVEDPTPA